jgi:small subunit ribosomal protein S4
MGDPRRGRKKYKTPKKLWDISRIREESQLKKEYGLKNMREIWIAQAELRRARREARRSLGLPEGKREEVFGKVVNKLARLGIVSPDATVDDILSLTVKDFLERRLQTRVFRKGLAKTPRQARQLIVHGYISIDGVRVTSPSRMITKEEEGKIGYYKDPSNIFKQPLPESSEEGNAEESGEGSVETESSSEAKAENVEEGAAKA